MLQTPFPEWLQGLMQKPGITDICLSGTKQVFYDCGGGLHPFTPPSWSDDQMHHWMITVLESLGRSWDARTPFLDARLPEGWRLHALFPPLSPIGLQVSLRKLGFFKNSQQSALSRWQTHNAPELAVLSHCARQGRTILISGGTGSGKTTLLNDLLTWIPPQERLISLEDTQELCPTHEHFVPLVSRCANADGFGGVSLRELLKQALRMRPDRIILGECRGEEVLELLQTLNTGHRGSMATLHANSTRDALKRVELMCALHSPHPLPIRALRELITACLDILVQVERSPQGRRIIEISEVCGMEGDTILLQPLVEQEKYEHSNSAKTDPIPSLSVVSPRDRTLLHSGGSRLLSFS